jgi:hypothetical protein
MNEDRYLDELFSSAKKQDNLLNDNEIQSLLEASNKTISKTNFGENKMKMFFLGFTAIAIVSYFGFNFLNNKHIEPENNVLNSVVSELFTAEEQSKIDEILESDIDKTEKYKNISDNSTEELTKENEKPTEPELTYNDELAQDKQVFDEKSNIVKFKPSRLIKLNEQQLKELGIIKEGNSLKFTAMNNSKLPSIVTLEKKDYTISFESNNNLLSFTPAFVSDSKGNKIISFFEDGKNISAISYNKTDEINQKREVTSIIKENVDSVDRTVTYSINIDRSVNKLDSIDDDISRNVPNRNSLYFADIPKNIDLDSLIQNGNLEYKIQIDDPSIEDVKKIKTPDLKEEIIQELQSETFQKNKIDIGDIFSLELATDYLNSNFDLKYNSNIKCQDLVCLNQKFADFLEYNPEEIEAHINKEVKSILPNDFLTKMISKILLKTVYSTFDENFQLIKDSLLFNENKMYEKDIKTEINSIYQMYNLEPDFVEAEYLLNESDKSFKVKLDTINEYLVDLEDAKDMKFIVNKKLDYNEDDRKLRNDILVKNLNINTKKSIIKKYFNLDLDSLTETINNYNLANNLKNNQQVIKKFKLNNDKFIPFENTNETDSLLFTKHLLDGSEELYYIEKGTKYELKKEESDFIYAHIDKNGKKQIVIPNINNDEKSRLKIVEKINQLLDSKYNELQNSPKDSNSEFEIEISTLNLNLDELLLDLDNKINKFEKVDTIINEEIVDDVKYFDVNKFPKITSQDENSTTFTFDNGTIFINDAKTDIDTSTIVNYQLKEYIGVTIDEKENKELVIDENGQLSWSEKSPETNFLMVKEYDKDGKTIETRTENKELAIDKNKNVKNDTLRTTEIIFDDDVELNYITYPDPNDSTKMIQELLPDTQKMIDDIIAKANRKKDNINFNHNINELIPVEVKLDGDELDYVLWFKPTMEFLSKLPADIQKRIAPEIMKINADGTAFCGEAPVEKPISDMWSACSGAILNLKLYPIPANDVINYSFELTSDRTLNIAITNINGKEIKSISKGKSFNSGEFQQSEGIANISPGIYYLTISSANGEIVNQRFIKEK